MSLPPRGAWIEISNGANYITDAVKSLPPRGAWIEIVIQSYAEACDMVAPPTGSVD